MNDLFRKKLHKIKAFAFDVDGVLSEPTVLLHPSGDLMRTMNTKDGYALQLAVKAGFRVAIITGGKSESLKLRFKGLGITDIYINSIDKVDDFNDFIYQYGINASEALYMGDDMPDYEVMTKVGVPTCPADASPEIKALSVYISSFNGGKGCVRDVIEQTLKIQGKWDLKIENYAQ